MNGPLAQIISLTCHANAILSGKEVENFFPENSTCQFCDRITFTTFKKHFFRKLKEKKLARTPDDWFSLLKNSGAKGVRLLQSPQKNPDIPDYVSEGFVGGGRNRYMEVLLPNNRSEFWIARWKVLNRKAPEQRIWNVTYGCISAKRTVKINPPDLANIKSQLAESLRETQLFADKMKSGYAQTFADALNILESGSNKLHGYHTDLVPEGFLSEEAITILDACQKSWVFGGMGSWSDMGFDDEDQNEYERISERLYHLINEAICASVNSAYYSLE